MSSFRLKPCDRRVLGFVKQAKCMHEMQTALLNEFGDKGQVLSIEWDDGVGGASGTSQHSETCNARFLEWRALNPAEATKGKEDSPGKSNKF
jgi:hypothetical protein